VFFGSAANHATDWRRRHRGRPPEPAPAANSASIGKSNPADAIPLVQGFATSPLPAGRFSEPFFFCLGFLASRLDRFCSLFATVLSLHVKSQPNMPPMRSDSTVEFA